MQRPHGGLSAKPNPNPNPNPNPDQVARRKQNARFLGDPRLATLTHGLSAKHCVAAGTEWPNHVADGRIPMEEVAAAHARARCCLVTCDPRHTFLEVGYTIRVVQGLGLVACSTLCAFDARFPVERIFRGLEGGDRDLAAELVLQGPDELVRLLEGMTAERYAAFVRVQHLAACHCRDAAAAEDPVAQLLQMTMGAHAAAPPAAQLAERSVESECARGLPSPHLPELLCRHPRTTR